MAEHEAKTTNASNVEFEHEFVKERFYNKLEQLYKDHDNHRKKITKQIAEETIATLIDIEMRKADDMLEGFTPDQLQLTFKYEVYKENYNTYLIKKRDKPDDPIVKYIPYEDAFDVLAEIHVNSGHGGRDVMYKQVRKDYVIPSPQIDCLISCCNVCNCNSLLTKQKYASSITHRHKNIVQLDIISMEDSPDGLFQYLLIYVFKESEYTLLRPVMRLCPLELSMELLKIFLDFGPPNQFEVYTKNRKLVQDSVLHLLGVFSKSTIPVYDTMKDGFNYSVRVLRSMQKWMKQTGGCNWGLSCHILQWQLNNYKNKEMKTPYTSLFGTTARFNNTEEFQLSDSEHKGDLEKEGENILQQNDLQIGSMVVVSDDDDDKLMSGDDEDPLFLKFVVEDSSQQAEESTSTKEDTVERPICYVCQCKIFKVYKCCQCQNPMHIFCSTRLEGTSADSPSFICTTCNIQRDE